MDHLVERVVEVLPVTSTGVTLISPAMAPRYVAASDQSAMRFERLQTEIGQGPCLVAYKSGEAVVIPDLGRDRRFPQFAPAALADVAAAYLLIAQSRDEARAISDRFHHNALHDPLTGLPNRLLLRERLERAAERRKRTHTNAAILFVDLDGFKQVNDAYGHQVGDELLIAIAHRLSTLVRSADTLARYAGDEFVFLCEDLHSSADAEILAARVEEAFESPFVLAGIGLTLAVTASIGIAFAGVGEGLSNELVVQADMAMYQVKRAGGAGHRIIDMQPFSLNSVSPTPKGEQ